MHACFGAEVEAEEEVPSQGVRAVALHTGPGRVELLSPLAADTPVGRFLERRGEGMHHVAFGVDDVEAELAVLRAAGATLIDEAAASGPVRSRRVRPSGDGGRRAGRTRGPSGPQLLEGGPMTDERIRFEIGFKGGGTTGGELPPDQLARLESALAGGRQRPDRARGRRLALVDPRGRRLVGAARRARSQARLRHDVSRSVELPAIVLGTPPAVR